MADVRISSKEMFVYYEREAIEGGKKNPVIGGCTNKRLLARATGVEYYVLMKVFTREGKCFYDDGRVVIMKLFTGDIARGHQSWKRKGRGGMDGFVRYVLKKDNGY